MGNSLVERDGENGSSSSIIEVAEHFLYLSSPFGIDSLKLQKVVYYAQAVHLVVCRTALFQEDFEAWVHGPMSPDLYYYCKQHNTRGIPPKTEPPLLNQKSRSIIEAVWKIYGNKTGEYLERKSFYEEPFQLTRKGIPFYEHTNAIISKELMKEYYEKKFSISKN